MPHTVSLSMTAATADAILSVSSFTVRYGTVRYGTVQHPLNTTIPAAVVPHSLSLHSVLYSQFAFPTYTVSYITIYHKFLNYVTYYH